MEYENYSNTNLKNRLNKHYQLNNTIRTLSSLYINNHNPKTDKPGLKKLTKISNSTSNQKWVKVPPTGLIPGDNIMFGPDARTHAINDLNEKEKAVNYDQAFTEESVPDELLYIKNLNRELGKTSIPVALPTTQNETYELWKDELTKVGRNVNRLGLHKKKLTGMDVLCFCYKWKGTLTQNKLTFLTPISAGDFPDGKVIRYGYLVLKKEQYNLLHLTDGKVFDKSGEISDGLTSNSEVNDYYAIC